VETAPRGCNLAGRIRDEAPVQRFAGKAWRRSPVLARDVFEPRGGRGQQPAGVVGVQEHGAPLLVHADGKTAPALAP